MKSARYNRLIREAKTREQRDMFHMERTFGAKAFDKKKKRRQIAKASKRANRPA